MKWFALSYLVVSLITFVFYGVDKRRARRGELRVPEKTLHTLELLGGWPGAWIGQRVFRHKTQKLSFRLVFWAIVALHLSLWAWLIYEYAIPTGD
jgi:uncharacterized membrane protein YsdA (DUF1294 family)